MGKTSVKTIERHLLSRGRAQPGEGKLQASATVFSKKTKEKLDIPLCAIKGKHSLLHQPLVLEAYK